VNFGNQAVLNQVNFTPEAKQNRSQAISLKNTYIGLEITFQLINEKMLTPACLAALSNKKKEIEENVSL
jgi:hypothetical protein